MTERRNNARFTYALFVSHNTPITWNPQNAQAAAALLEYGAKADLTVGDSLTPLHEAVGAGSIAVAEMLVRAGANVSVQAVMSNKPPRVCSPF